MDLNGILSLVETRCFFKKVIRKIYSFVEKRRSVEISRTDDEKNDLLALDFLEEENPRNSKLHN